MSRIPSTPTAVAAAIVLVALLAVLPIGAPASVSPVRSLSAPSCPLSPAQEQSAVSAFDEMMPVLFHPRCLNCHGAVNPFVDPQTGGHLGGNMTDSATGSPMPSSSCEDCHGELPGWDTPGQAMFFVGKNAKDLCMQFKDFEPTGSLFVGHIERDNGGIQFIATAFQGTRALNTLGETSYEEAVGHAPAAEPPPGTHRQFAAAARDWVNAMGAGWTASRDCGCMVHGAWYGTVSARGRIEGLPYTLTLASDANVIFEIDSSWKRPRADRRSVYYKTTGGMATWSARASNGCRGGLSGTMPLDTIDEDGHPMGELRLEDLGNGTTRYEATTGSWPDRWSPIFNVRCDMSGTMVDMPALNYIPGWWLAGEVTLPPMSVNPHELRGSYRYAPAPGIDILYQWDLKLQP